MILGLSLAVVGHALLSQAEFVPTIHQQNFILSMNSLGLLGISLYIVNGYPYLMKISSAANSATGTYSRSKPPSSPLRVSLAVWSGDSCRAALPASYNFPSTIPPPIGIHCSAPPC